MMLQDISANTMSFSCKSILTDKKKRITHKNSNRVIQHLSQQMHEEYPTYQDSVGLRIEYIQATSAVEPAFFHKRPILFAA